MNLCPEFEKLGKKFVNTIKLIIFEAQGHTFEFKPMRKSFTIAPAILLCLVSCDNSYDLKNIDTEIQILPGITVPVVEKQNIISSSDLFDSKVSHLEIKTTDNFNVTVSEAQYGQIISIPDQLTFDTAGKDMPSFMKNAKSRLLFDEGAAVEVSVSNPLPCPILLKGDITDGTVQLGMFSQEIPSTGSTSAKATVQIKLNSLDLNYIPGKLIVKNICLKPLGASGQSAGIGIRTEAAGNILSFSGALSVPCRFRKGSKLEFDYEFSDFINDFNIDLSQFKDFETSEFILKGKVSSNLPLTLEASANGDINATITPFSGPCTDAPFTLSAETPGGINSVRTCKLHFNADLTGDINLEDIFEVNIRVNGVNLPKGLILNGEK